MFSKMIRVGMVALLALGAVAVAQAEELCAEVRIEILQELAMERQGFEAMMRIHNSLDSFDIRDVSVTVYFEDADGNSVKATSNTAASDAEFFIRVDGTQQVSSLQTGTDGQIENGVIAPGQTGELRWLIIPTANAAGQRQDGELYYVGARLSYTYGGKSETVDVAPDSIVVIPQPALTLDYFLTQEVIGNDAFTTEVEPPEPYTLGVRLSNNGYGVARSVTIESAQPRIVENELGLAVDFTILGSFLEDQPAEPSLLLNFGDVAPGGVKNGRWIMETSLSGRFTAFTASFTHADELGGALTSLLEATNAHFLKRDVLVDLPGRDNVRDFLAYGPTGGLYVYESEPTGLQEPVCDNCARVVELDASYQHFGDEGTLIHDPEAGFSFAQVTDPYAGERMLQRVVRSDGKVIHTQNAWLSKERADNNRDFNHYLNIFDAGSTGEYTVHWGDETAHEPQPPVIRFIPDMVTYEGGSLGFLVVASDPNGATPLLSSGSLPSGASFIDQGNGSALFEWHPTIGQTGQYTVTFVAGDGVLTAERRVNIQVHPWYDTDGDGMDDAWEMEHFGTLDRDGTGDYSGNGRTDLQEFLEGTDPTVADIIPGTPQIKYPLYDADTLDGQEAPWFPVLEVTNAPHSTGIDDVSVIFEVYSDEGMNDQVARVVVTEGDTTTRVQLNESHLLDDQAFADNTLYYWRVRAEDNDTGASSSLWSKSRFFINTFNNPPTQPQISSPAPDSLVGELRPRLAVTNAIDVDRDRLYYAFALYNEDDMSVPVAEVSGLAPGASGETGWRVPTELNENTGYLWQVVVTDEHGLATESEWGFFLVSTHNDPPTAPVIDSPAIMAEIEHLNEVDGLELVVLNAEDPERMPLTYGFELDVVNTFDSPDKQVSGVVPEGEERTGWMVSGLADNTRYYWRVRAFDGELYGDWALGEFVVSTREDPPAAPTLQNPVDGAAAATLRPLLEVNPVAHPQSDSFSYRFELYGAPEQGEFIAEYLSDTTQWRPDFDLSDATTYYWRARAELDADRVGEWSVTGSFKVRLPPVNRPPEMSFVLPDADIVVEDDQVLLQWVDSAPDSPALITLFYHYEGGDPQVLAEGLSVDDDGEGDKYLWDTSGLPAGEYRVSAIIADEETEVPVEHCCLIIIPERESDRCVLEDPAAESYPAWQAQVAYSQGERVQFDSLVWQAKWWNQGSSPLSSHSAWELVSDVEYPWHEALVYEAGAEVNHIGRRWRAQWWTQAQVPGAVEVWLDIGEGSCGGSGPDDGPEPEPVPECDAQDPAADQYPAWESGETYVGGEQVNYQGVVWEALWWNIDAPPLSDNAPWRLISDVDLPWSESLIYHAGDEVNHQGQRWRAQWWVQGEAPGQSGAWGAIGDSSCR